MPSKPRDVQAARPALAQEPQAASRRERTRANLLAVARAEFADKGFAGTRVDEVAETAGVNKQAIYHHFGSKDGLFQATLEAGYAQVRRTNLAYAASARPTQPADALRHAIEHIFDRFHTHPEMVELVLEENRQRGRHLAHRELVEEANEPMVTCIADALAAGAADGIFVSDVSASQLFFDIVSLCMFFFANVHTMSASLHEDFSTKAAARARKAHIARQVLRGLQARGS